MLPGAQRRRLSPIPLLQPIISDTKPKADLHSLFFRELSSGTPAYLATDPLQRRLGANDSFICHQVPPMCGRAAWSAGASATATYPQLPCVAL